MITLQEIAPYLPFWLGDQERFGKDIININSLKQWI